MDDSLIAIAAHMLAAPDQGGAPMLSPEGRLNVNARRPFIDTDGRPAILVQNAAGQWGKLKINAPALLRYDEWRDIDTTVIQAATQRMVAFADLRSRGLEHPLGSIGVTVSMWQTQGDMTEAEISMSAMTRSERDTPEFDTSQVPVPIVHKEFWVELRRLIGSRRSGEGIDVTGAAIAGRLVGERSERMLLLGAGIQVDGATVYGYTTHPNRNTIDLAENWDLGATTGADIVDDIQQALAALRADGKYGPFMIYIPSAYEGKMGEDYRDSDERTIRARIMELSPQILGIQVTDFLPANNIVVVQLTRDVVDLAIAQDVSTVQWSLMGGMAEEFKTMAVWVPRIKADQDGKSGIVHIRPA